MYYQSFEEFLASDSMFHQSQYFKVDVYEIYFRRQHQLIDGKRRKVITVANILRIDGKVRVHQSPVDTSTGRFKELLAYLDALSQKHGYEGIMFECVHNEWLPAKLQSYGFELFDNVNRHLYRKTEKNG